MIMLLAKVKETINKYGMAAPGDRVVVAVSGGPDSVCLLSVLNGLAAEWNLSLHVAHLDHMFRGKQSADEALFVADLAKKLNIPATIEKIDVPAYCRERGLSAQTGAREVRYSLFMRVARSVGASRIATGHTANDQAETFLMRLLRGAGVAGLSAIPPVRANIIRPLIEVTRQEVLEYLRAKEIGFVSDPSNSKPVYTRNRIRMDVLPALERFNPRIVETLATEAALLRDEDAAMEEYLGAVVSSVCIRENESLVIKRAEFNPLFPALKRRLIKKAVDLAGGESRELSSAQVEEALVFMAGAQTGRAMRLPGGLTIEREYDKFLIGASERTETFCRTLTVPGLTAVPELGVEIDVSLSDDRTREPKKNYRWQAAFDYDKIKTYLTLRNRRPGDRFCPSGMEGKSKKLQDYFVDEKIPLRLRDRIPILCAGDDILWVVGRRTDGRFLPQPGTVKVLAVGVGMSGERSRV